MAVARCLRYANSDAAGVGKMVHTMITRVYGVGLAAVLCLGSMLASDAAFARSGGFGGRSFAFSSGFPPSALRSASPLHRRFGFAPLLRRDGLAPLTVLGGGLYGPSDYVDPNYQPAYAEPEVVTGAIPGGGYPVFVYRRGCHTQTVTVPSEDGGERTINIVRCY